MGNIESAPHAHASGPQPAGAEKPPTLDTPRGYPRLVAEEAVNDLIRYSLVPAVIVPAIIPALESALMQMVPAVLGRAVTASQLRESSLPASPDAHTSATPFSPGLTAFSSSHGAEPSSAPTPFEQAVVAARLASLRDRFAHELSDLIGTLDANGASATTSSPSRPSSPSTAVRGGYGLPRSPPGTKSAAAAAAAAAGRPRSSPASQPLLASAPPPATHAKTAPRAVPGSPTRTTLEARSSPAQKQRRRSSVGGKPPSPKAKPAAPPRADTLQQRRPSTAARPIPAPPVPPEPYTGAAAAARQAAAAVSAPSAGVAHRAEGEYEDEYAYYAYYAGEDLPAAGDASAATVFAALGGATAPAPAASAAVAREASPTAAALVEAASAGRRHRSSPTCGLAHADVADAPPPRACSGGAGAAAATPSGCFDRAPFERASRPLGSRAAGTPAAGVQSASYGGAPAVAPPAAPSAAPSAAAGLPLPAADDSADATAAQAANGTNELSPPPDVPSRPKESDVATDGSRAGPGASAERKPSPSVGERSSGGYADDYWRTSTAVPGDAWGATPEMQRVDGEYLAMLASGPQAVPASVAALNDEELEEAASCFASFDARGSGSLNESQFGALVTAARRAVGGPAPTAAQLADTFTEADVGADGSIDFSEFALYVRAHVDADLALVVATHTFSAEPDGH